MTPTIDTQKPYRIFAEHVEQTALDQFELAMQQPSNVQGALMPDAHTGYTLPIGAVIASEGVVYCQYVGYDIGCGMLAAKTSLKADDVRSRQDAIFDAIYQNVPVGFACHPAWQCIGDYELANLAMTSKLADIFNEKGNVQIGTLGSGNHFISLDHDENDDVWVVIHSGSRGVGHGVASHYMRLASHDGKCSEGHYGFDVDSQVGKDYIIDLEFCLRYALLNRHAILQGVIKSVGGCDIKQVINRNHNHAELRDGLWIHRKGATHAESGMWGVIPGNMRDGSFIVKGKGNPESLWSSSHGAGRVLGRKEAKRTLDLSAFEATMQGVKAKVCQDTIDESPMAYKDIWSVMAQQTELVEVVHHLKPIVNIKA